MSNGRLSVSEIESSEGCILKYVQEVYFSDVIFDLLHSSYVSRKHVLAKFNPFIDDLGLLRIRGRISKAVSSYDVKHPIILPAKSSVSYMLVRNTHETVGHLGRGTVISALRQKYWIIGVSAMAKRVVNDCIGCRKRHGRPSVQIMADLPGDRLDGDDARIF